MATEAEMLMRVRERNDVIEIQLTRLNGRQQAVVEALGRENDAAVDRSKLESMSLRARADAMDVRLRAKAGERLDPIEIYRSLRRALLSGRSAFLSPIGDQATL